MISNKQDFIDMLKVAGMKLSTTDVDSLERNEYLVCANKENHIHFDVVIGRGEGYNGFYATFTFNADGKFLRHGVWE